MLETYPGKQFDGDGTVSEMAAIPPEMESDDGVYIAQRHASLQNTRTVLDHSLKILADHSSSDLRAVDVNASLRIRDAYMRRVSLLRPWCRRASAFKSFGYV